MLLIIILISVLISYIRGGSIYNLETIPYDRRSKYLLFLFIIDIGLRIIANVGSQNIASIVMRIIPYYTILLYAGLIYTVGLNRHLKHTWIIQSGLLLNMLPIAFNSGKMPVSAEALGSIKEIGRLEAIQAGQMYNHTLINESTRFWIFSDIIPINIGNGTVISIGDILLAVGIILFIVHYSTDKN